MSKIILSFLYFHMFSYSGEMIMYFPNVLMLQPNPEITKALDCSCAGQNQRQQATQTRQDRPKTSSRDTKRTPQRPQEEPKRLKKASPNRKSQKEPNETIQRPSWTSEGPDFPRSDPCAPRGPFGTPQRHQNRSQNDQKIETK